MKLFKEIKLGDKLYEVNIAEPSIREVEVIDTHIWESRSGNTFVGIVYLSEGKRNPIDVYLNGYVTSRVFGPTDVIVATSAREGLAACMSRNSYWILRREGLPNYKSEVDELKRRQSVLGKLLTNVKHQVNEI